MAIIFNLFFGLILIAGGLLFSILAYIFKKQTYFYIALTAIILTAILIISEYQLYISAILSGEIIIIGFALAWIISIVFLVMSQLTTQEYSNSQAVTREYLDSIIEADEEEWDPES